MSVLVSQVLNRATTLLQDAGMVRWTEAELLGWLNDGQRELVKLKKDAKVKTADYQLVSGARQAVPQDCVLVLEIPQNTNGNVVLRCDKKAMDGFAPGWLNKPTASVVKNWMDDPDPRMFYVYPAQNETPASVVLVYSAYPATVGINDPIDVLDIYADNLVNFVLYRAFSKDAEFGGDASRAVAYYQAFAA